MSFEGYTLTDLYFYNMRRQEIRQDIGKNYADSNKEAIAIFCKLKDGSFGKEDAKYFPQDLRDKIKQRLLSLYCSND